MLAEKVKELLKHLDFALNNFWLNVYSGSIFLL